MAAIGIVSIILSAAQLAVGIASVAGQPTPDPPSGLKNKSYWIQCTVKNETQFTIVMEGTYFDSGRYWTGATGMGKFEQMVFSACEGDGTWMTGVSGGNTFKILVDDNVSYDFALGWTNPYVGSMKAGVAESSKAEDGYNAATSNGNSITSSEKYTGKDTDGKPAAIKFHISATPGQEMAFQVTEIRV